MAEVIRHLPPEIKHGVKSALRALSIDPDLGSPLSGELEGLWTYRVRRFRIVYALDRERRKLDVWAVGHRRSIYDEVRERFRHPPQS